MNIFTYGAFMDKIHYTNHATIRVQQRGIPKKAIDFIIKHGKTVNTHGDRKSFIPTKKFNSLLKDKEHAITLKKLDKHIKSTAVITTAEGLVITAFKINKRMNWRNK